MCREVFLTYYFLKWCVTQRQKTDTRIKIPQLVLDERNCIIILWDKLMMRLHKYFVKNKRFAQPKMTKLIGKQQKIAKRKTHNFIYIFIRDTFVSLISICNLQRNTIDSVIKTQLNLCHRWKESYSTSAKHTHKKCRCRWKITADVIKSPLPFWRDGISRFYIQIGNLSGNELCRSVPLNEWFLNYLVLLLLV